MKVSEINEQNLTEELVDKILYEGLEDSGESADCIMVLGSIKASKYRVPVAVEAYKAGRAPKILLCGGAVREFAEGSMPEAEHMKRKALELGVPEEDILLESHSLYTVENMLCALLELERSFGLSRMKKVVLVTTTYHMRRSYLMARSYFPDWIEILPCPADDTSTRRDNWRTNESGRKRAIGEALKIAYYINDGDIPDFEV